MNLTPARRIGVGGVGLALVWLAGCPDGCKDARRGQAPGDAASATEPIARPADGWRDALADLPAVTPAWQRAVPGEPGRRVIERTAGPVVIAADRGDESVMVASSLIGFAALDAETGDVLWRRPGERYPGPPVPWPEPDTGRKIAPWTSSIALPGRCDHRRTAPSGSSSSGPSSRPPDSSATGFACIERVAREDGALLRRVWLDPAPVPAPGAASLSRFLAWTPDHRGLWLHGDEIRAFALTADSPTGSLEARYRWPEAAAIRVCGVAADPRALAVATCDGLALYRRSQDPDPGAARWHHRSARSPGVAGPVLIGERVIWSHDHHLEALEGEGGRARRRWRAEGRHAYAPGALVRVTAGRDAGADPDRSVRLLAVRLDGGIRPVVIDPGSGAMLASGARAPGVQVLHAALRADQMVLVVRLDSSLLHDAIIAYDRDLAISWAWPLPVPARPRVAPIAVALARSGVVVFHGGRYVARLPLP